MKEKNFMKDIKETIKKSLTRNIANPEVALTENELNGICAACNGWMFKSTTTKIDLAEELRDYFEYNPGEAKQFWETPEEVEQTIEKIMNPWYTTGQIFFYTILFWGGYDAEEILEDVARFFVLR